MKLKNYFSLLIILISSLAFAQNRVIGTIRSEKTDKSMYNVKVILASPDEKNYYDQTFTDENGGFTLETKEKSAKLIFKLNGYKTQYKFIELNQKTTDIGMLFLEEQILKDLENESSLVDLAFYRKSPTATSTIYESQHFNLNSNKDFIERTNNLPGVYTTTLGGGHGDTQIRMRGYDESGITPILDGISLRNFETGLINWNFIGPASDALDAVQIQRGLGSSKLNASVAGTINFVLRDPFKKNDNYISVASGNDGYSKYALNLSSGNIKKGFGINFMLSHTRGDGYVENTDFKSYGYYLGLGYKNNQNAFTFKLLGAPQKRNTNNKIATLAALHKFHGGINNKYNFTYGYYNDEKISLFENTLHMPTATLEWKYDINSNNIFTAKAYGIFGVSGLTKYAGTDPSFTTGNFYTQDGKLNYDYIQLYNTGLATNTIIYEEDVDLRDYIRDQTPDGNGNNLYLNSIEWDNTRTGFSLVNLIEKKTSYGFLMNYTKKINQIFKLDFGAETMRSIANQSKYLGNLFGADGYIIDPNNSTRFTTETYKLPNHFFNVFEKNTKQKIDFNNINYADYLGLFSQIEFNPGAFNLLFQGGYNLNQYYKTWTDLYDGTTETHSKKVNLNNYHIKLGANWNFNDKNNIWMNVGIVNRAPVFNSVFEADGVNTTMNYGAEKFRAIELGYSHIRKTFNVNIATYYNALYNSTIPLNDISLGFIGTTDRINKTNIGLELDFTYKPFTNLSIISSNSYAQWKYDKNAVYIDYDPANPTTNLFVKDQKIGGAPQWMNALTLAYEPIKNLSWSITGKHHAQFYSNTAAEQYDPAYYPTSFASNSLLLPSFTLFDTALKYRIILLNEHKVSLGLNLNNIFDTLYINEATKAYTNNQLVPNSTLTYGQMYPKGFKNINGANTAYFGFGRTWNFAVRYDF